jgi:type IV fimbrial biogenesis protein FimT
MRRTRGLTLLELMVTLGILAVLLSLALPSFGSILARQRLKAAAEHLAVDLAELRFDATRRGLPLHAQFVTGSDWCYALATVSGCDCRTPQPCQMKTVRARDFAGVTLVDARSVSFAPMQPGDGAVGHALLQLDDGAQLRVGLTRLGRPAICAPAGVVAGYPGC